MNWLSHWDEWLDDLESDNGIIEEIIEIDGKKTVSFAYKKVTEEEINELFKD